MNPSFSYSQYTLKRQTFALTGKVRVFGPSSQLLFYSEQKMFKLREDIRVFSDEQKSQEILRIQARQIIDFSAAYDVVDARDNSLVGVLRRKGFRSLVRDQWEVLDPQEKLLGYLEEDSTGLALVRRLFMSLIPLNYDIRIGESIAADIRQRFNPFRYELDLDFSMDAAGLLDRRLGIAAGVMLAIVEGRQN
jgi:hypothetical protein